MVFERRGLADAGEGISPDVFDELVDAREHLAVGLEPGDVVFPALVFEYQPYRRYRMSFSSGSTRSYSAMWMPFRAFS
jgi:hypothetical protein